MDNYSHTTFKGNEKHGQYMLNWNREHVVVINKSIMDASLYQARRCLNPNIFKPKDF